MKKQFLAIAALLFTVQLANAQTEKGKQTLGFTAGYSTQKNENVVNNPATGYLRDPYTKSTTFQIGPTYSYFVADGLDVGTSLGYANTSYEDNSTSTVAKQNNRSYSGSVFVRKYFLYEGMVGIRTGAHAGYTRSETNYSYASTPNPADVTNKGNEYSGGLSLEGVFYPSKHVGIAATLATANYRHSKIDNGIAGSSTSNSFNIAFASSFTYLSVFYTF